MSKVLFVLPFFPYPLVSGGSQAMYNGMVAAASAGAELYLVYPDYGTSEEDRQALSRALEGKIRIFPFPMHVNKKGEELLNLIYRLKYNAKKLIRGESAARPKAAAPYKEWMSQMMPKSEAFCQYINDLVSRHTIDIIQCEMLDTLALGLTLPPHVKKYFVHHELGFVRKSQHAYLEQEPLAGQANLEINRVVEIDLLNRFDTVITLSETDTGKLKAAGVTSRLLTSFATINHAPQSISDHADEDILAFVGPELHPPNKEGLLWFLHNSWDRLLSAHPDIQLRVIGQWTEETQRELCKRYKQIQFLGYVEDLSAAIRGTIMIVPILTGSGIRMKILEAGLIGAPVVTTSVGVEGIPLVNGENCFIADKPEDFEKGILALSDQTLRERFIRSTQQIIADRYSQQALIKNRAELYQ